MATQIVAINATDSVEFGEFAVYGVNNQHVVKVSGGTGFKLKYRVKVTTPDADEYIFDIKPIGTIAKFDPFKVVAEMYFKSKLDLTQPFDTMPKGFNIINIEAGQIKADNADEPATFRGYDSFSQDVYFYNGYEDKGLITNQYINEEYCIGEIELPYDQKTLYVAEGDSIKLFAWSHLPYYVGGNASNLPNLKELKLTLKEKDGTQVSQTVTAFTQTSIGLWSTDFITATALTNGRYYEAIFNYISTQQAGQDSEPIIIKRLECSPVFEPQMLLWINSKGLQEHLYFTQNKVESLDVKRGKSILRSNIDNDYTGDNASFFTDPIVANKVEVGNEYTRRITLNSNWLTQEQLDAFKYAYKSPQVKLKVDNVTNISGANLLPCTIRGSDYEILEVKQGLQKISVELTVAVNEKKQFA